MATSQMKPLKNILPATTTRKLASDRIYKMCYSVHEAFGLPSNKTSSKSSFTSESSAVLYPQPNTTILLLATFNGDDPQQPIVLPELTRSYLLHHLLSVHPVAAVGGRRTINVQSPPVSTYFLPEMNHYLVLKSIKVSMAT
ncbi:unnamed protein product [Rotaria sordida]|uniref:Uncharacterized protein n=1 Tax=Rotaria sordida TaxID=392033 RepID=A0A813RV43_9BILA|nr:unnamed protein product [Rotaria sordida]